LSPFLAWVNTLYKEHPTYLIGPLQKEVETMEASQNRRFYGKMECLPLWHTYIGEKGRTLGKTYG
jgi:hypothetical protein